MPSARAFCVISLAKPVLVAAEIFGDDDGGVVRGLGDDALDRVLDRDGLAGLEFELGRRLLGGVFGDFERRIELDLAGVEALEQQIERHHLGQRGRMPQCVRVRCLQDGAAIAVDHDRGRRRRIFFGAWRDDERDRHGRNARGRDDDAARQAASLVIMRAAARPRPKSPTKHRNEARGGLRNSPMPLRTPSLNAR